MSGAANELIRLILSLSVSGGLLALVLFALKPFVKNKLSKSFQYYIWTVVLIRLILPFSFGINLMDFTFNPLYTSQIVNDATLPAESNAEITDVAPMINNNIITPNTVVDTTSGVLPSPLVLTDNAAEKPLDFTKLLTDNLLFIWFAGLILSLAFNILGYLRFIRYIRCAAYEIPIMDCAAAVYKSRFAPIPMLAGIIKPRIYLPDKDYTEEHLNNILLHELTHLRRYDVLLKWFTTFVVSAHWFNPTVYFIRREFNHACELSCDEAVIRSLDSGAKQGYGNTLIAVVAESRYPGRMGEQFAKRTASHVGAMSTTMCEEKKKLKERLVAIMDYRRKTKVSVLITVVLTFAITSSAFAFGANIGLNNKNQETTPGYTDEVTHDAINQPQIPNVLNDTSVPTPTPRPELEHVNSSELDFEYITVGDEVTITKYIGANSKVVIPKQINGHTVVGIGDNAFYDNINLNSVTIPDSVTSIGDYTFFHCINLTDIIIPDNVTSIGEYAFYSCWNLTNIAIPDSVASIGEFAFSFCSLTSVTLPKNLTSIVENVFADCRSLTDIIIPDSVTSIGDSAFVYCDSLTSVTIPDGVASIGNYAFYKCWSLTSITIPNSVTNIGESAFEGCHSLESVYFEGSAPKVGPKVFYEPASNFTIYYKSSTDGWMTPEWNGYPAHLY